MSLVLGCAMLVNNMKNHNSIWNEFKHSFKRGIFSSSTALLIGTFASQSFAAPATLEIFSSSGTTGVSGPSSSNQTLVYRLNANNPSDDNNTSSYTPQISSTYSITSDYNVDRYTNNGTFTQPSFVFGGGSNSDQPTMEPRTIFQSLDAIGNPSSIHFASTLINAPTGCGATGTCTTTSGGISVTANYGVGYFASTRGIGIANLSRTGRHKVGTITVNFSVPVTNPVLHVAGLGGRSSTGQGFSAEFDLVSNSSASGVTMSRLTGSTELSVTDTQIRNVANRLNATTGSGGASGSVYLEGRRISSLTFNVFLRGDGNAAWYNPNTVSGDLFYFAVSSLEADHDINIVKTQSKSTSDSFVRTELTDIPIGLTTQYRLLITNNSTRDIDSRTPASISDVIPSNFTNVSIVGTPTVTGTGTSCTGSLSGNTFTGSFYGPAQSTCTVTLQATATTAGSLTNTANLFESSTDPDTTNNSSSVNATIINGAKIKIAKRSVGDVGTFNFSSISNLQNTTTDVTSTSLTTTVAGTAVTSAQLWAKSLNTAVNITEDALTNYQLASAVCTDANSATTGNTGNFGTLVNNTLTIAAANIKNGADITCTFTNEKKRNLTIRKSWSNAKINDAVNITATGLTDFSAIAETASEIDSAGAKLATVGAQITIAESFTTGSSANYNASLQCMTERTTPTVVTVTNNQITMPDENVTCTYTNTGTFIDLSIVKTQRAGTSGTFTRDPVGIIPIPLVSSTVEYQLVMTNNGPTAVTGATFSDAIPSPFTFSSIVSQTGGGGATACTATENPSGSDTVTGTFSGPVGATCTVVIRANAPFLATQGTYTNTATISTPSGISDSDTTNNSSSVQTAISPAADMAIEKQQSLTNGSFASTAISVNQGGNVFYQIKVTNNGPTAITGVLNTASFTDTVPTNITNLTLLTTATAACPAPTINGQVLSGSFTGASGASCTYVVQGTASTVGSMTNTATVSSTGLTDSITSNNSSSVNLTIVPAADLEITKSDGLTATYTGDEVTYTIAVTNKGPSAANGALFRDAAATGLTKTSLTCSATNSASCPTAANLTIANIESSNGLAIPTLPNGGVVTFTIKANVTATSGNVSNVATITAPSGTTDPVSTNNSATDTDSVLTPIVIQGKVFEDNSGTTGIASNAYNAVQNTGEVGIANSTVQLTNCSGTVLATTETDAVGQYQFAVSQATLPSPNFCVVQTNVDGYTSVSGTTGYTRGTDTITVPKATSGNYTDLNFGDAKLNLILTENGQHTVVAGAVTDYPHRLQTDATVQVTGITQTLNQQPSSASDQDWQALIYRDSNCNGTVDAGEVLFNPTTSTPVTLLPSAAICLVQRVHVPTNVYAGAQHNAQLEASYSVTLSNPAQTLTGDSNTVQDTTLTGSAGLELSKKVRKVASCPSTVADTAVFSTVNEATTLDKLEYEITYKNNSVKNLQNVKIKDAVPTGTTFGSISCQSTPSGNSCTPTQTGEALLWQLTGNLSPASSGTVRFCVTPQ